MTKELLIGTRNRAKEKFYANIFRSVPVNLLTLNDFPTIMGMEEEDISVEENSRNKALTYSRLTNLAVLSDDTAIFIPAINNEPGVAVRRWGGMLPKNVTDEAWVDFFLKRIEGIPSSGLTCFKKQVATIALPNGDNWQAVFVAEGRIVQNNSYSSKYYVGSPFSVFFYLDKYKKLESDLSEQEMDDYLAPFRKELLDALSQAGLIAGLS